MPRTRGMDYNECDKCGKKEILTPDAPAQANWHEKRRITAQGTVQPFLLCNKCNDAYQPVAEMADRDFEEFIRGKKD